MGPKPSPIRPAQRNQDRFPLANLIGGRCFKRSAILGNTANPAASELSDVFFFCLGETGILCAELFQLSASFLDRAGDLRPPRAN